MYVLCTRTWKKGGEKRMKHILHYWMDIQSQKIDFIYWDDKTDKVFEINRSIEHKE